MTDNRLGLRVIQGCETPVERIALSLVHPRGRIDIPVSAILRVKALRVDADAEQQARISSLMFGGPHVDVYLTKAIRDRIFRLTRQIVDEPIDIVIGGRCIYSPIVREPLGLNACFQISANDLAEAQALAHQIHTGWSIAGPRVIP